MTSDAPFRLHRGMLIDKWTLLVRVTLDACRICTGSKSGLFEFKTAMWIVAVAALHGSFKNLVMERKIKLVLHLGMTTEAQLRFAYSQQLKRRDAWLLSVRGSNEDVRTGQIPTSLRGMRRVAIGATNIISPMLTAPKVIVFFFARVACKTRL